MEPANLYQEVKAFVVAQLVLSVTTSRMLNIEFY